MNTYHILPPINDINFAGRLTADAVINEKGNRAEFSLARTFGGDAGSVFLNNIILFGENKGKKPITKEVLDLLKKGTAVTITARFVPNPYEKDGKVINKTRIVVKTIAAAELIEKQYESDKAPADEEAIDIEIEAQE